MKRTTVILTALLVTARLTGLRAEQNQGNHLQPSQPQQVRPANVASHLTAQKSRPVPISVTVSPNPPVAGANKIDLLVTDPKTGKPVTGLKLQAAVAMTSMNMGSDQPPVKEVGKGHYVVDANFSMEGPWRVTLTGLDRKRSTAVLSLDFVAGSKDPWVQPANLQPVEPTQQAGEMGGQGTQSGGCCMGM